MRVCVEIWGQLSQFGFCRRNDGKLFKNTKNKKNNHIAGIQSLIRRQKQQDCWILQEDKVSWLQSCFEQMSCKRNSKNLHSLCFRTQTQTVMKLSTVLLKQQKRFGQVFFFLMIDHSLQSYPNPLAFLKSNSMFFFPPPDLFWLTSSVFPLWFSCKTHYVFFFGCK